MNKEEALQKVNAYCTEKQYTTATLTDAFKEKFAEHFAKSYPDAPVDDEVAIANMKFALNSAFSGASLIITDKSKEFETKENDYKTKIAELEKKAKQSKPTELELSKEVQEKLAAYDKFIDDEKKVTKFKNIIELAKSGIRQNLHTSFEKFAQDYDVKLDKEDKEQADALVTRFKEIFKDSIGDITPLTPQQTIKRDEDFISSIKKVKVQ